MRFVTQTSSGDPYKHQSLKINLSIHKFLISIKYKYKNNEFVSVWESIIVDTCLEPALGWNFGKPIMQENAEASPTPKRELQAVTVLMADVRIAPDEKQDAPAVKPSPGSRRKKGFSEVMSLPQKL